MASSQEDIEAVFHAKGGLFFVRLKTRGLAIVQLVTLTKKPGELIELIEAAPPEAIEQHPEMAPVRPELWHLVLHESAIVARLEDFEGNDLARFLMWRGVSYDGPIFEGDDDPSGLPADTEPAPADEPVGAIISHCIEYAGQSWTARFTHEAEGFWSVVFYGDAEGCTTQGKTEAEALERAKAALACWHAAKLVEEHRANPAKLERALEVAAQHDAEHARDTRGVIPPADYARTAVVPELVTPKLHSYQPSTPSDALRRMTRPDEGSS